MEREHVEVTAFELPQGDETSLYQFNLQVSVLRRITTIMELDRDNKGRLKGYQRSGSDQYIGDIAAYLRKGEGLLPNSIVLSLPTGTTYCSQPSGSTGRLEIPVSEGESEIRIVDGQQRMRALARTGREDTPMPVTAFITDDVAFERDQFFRINRSLSLPSGLVNELLPVLHGPLPERLRDRKIPSILCDRLDRDDSSPLKGMIRRSSKSNSQRAVIKDSSMMGAIQNSLSSPSGCLFPYHNIATGEVAIEEAMEVLTVFWGAVREVFGEAWGLPAKRSRLMHSAGIQVMGEMMDLIMPSISPTAPDAREQAACELERIAPACQWTSGSWDGLGGLAWNDLKGTKRHVKTLSRHLADIYYEDLPS